MFLNTLFLTPDKLDLVHYIRGLFNNILLLAFFALLLPIITSTDSLEFTLGLLLYFFEWLVPLHPFRVPVEIAMGEVPWRISALFDVDVEPMDLTKAS